MVCVCKRASGLILQESEATDSNDRKQNFKIQIPRCTWNLHFESSKKDKKKTPHDSVQMFYKKIELLKEFNLLEKPATKH